MPGRVRNVPDSGCRDRLSQAELNHRSSKVPGADIVLILLIIEKIHCRFVTKKRGNSAVRLSPLLVPLTGHIFPGEAAGSDSQTVPFAGSESAPL